METAAVQAQGTHFVVVVFVVVRFGSDRKSLQRKEWRRLLPGLNFPGPNNFYLKNANKLGTEKVNMKLQQFDNITQTVHVETKMLKITNRAK